MTKQKNRIEIKKYSKLNDSEKIKFIYFVNKDIEQEINNKVIGETIDFFKPFNIIDFNYSDYGEIKSKFKEGEVDILDFINDIKINEDVFNRYPIILSTLINKYNYCIKKNTKGNLIGNRRLFEEVYQINKDLCIKDILSNYTPCDNKVYVKIINNEITERISLNTLDVIFEFFDWMQVNTNYLIFCYEDGIFHCFPKVGYTHIFSSKFNVSKLIHEFKMYLRSMIKRQEKIESLIDSIDLNDLPEYNTELPLDEIVEIIYDKIENIKK